MKRVISFCVLLFIIIGLNCKKKDEFIDISGIINFINGDVKLILEDGKIIKANVGDEIRQGITLKTSGDKSFVDIYFGDNIVKVLGNTVVNIKRLLSNVNADTEEYQFFVEKGGMFSRVKRKLAKGDVYSVMTPTTTAGVRGTDFLVSEEDGQANVACLSGLVSVLNNSLTDTEPVVLEEREETDIIPGQNMVKKQISADRMRMLNILLEIKEMREEIRRKFEKQREEIRKHVVDQREKDKDILDKQREKDRSLVEDQKKRDQGLIKGIQDETEGLRDDVVGDAKGKMDEAKDVDKESAKKRAEDQKEAMKPKIEKFKFNKDQFKGKQKE
ncbi:MAG: FecR domain-containing protein [Spirochaetota bacterium]|nr:FecR domain-containing protein [Spirochaetota bacterium]